MAQTYLASDIYQWSHFCAIIMAIYHIWNPFLHVILHFMLKGNKN